VSLKRANHKFRSKAIIHVHGPSPYWIDRVIQYCLAVFPFLCEPFVLYECSRHNIIVTKYKNLYSIAILMF
jgi:hypothetical protein